MALSVFLADTVSSLLKMGGGRRDVAQAADNLEPPSKRRKLSTDLNDASIRAGPSDNASPVADAAASRPMLKPLKRDAAAAVLPSSAPALSQPHALPPASQPSRSSNARSTNPRTHDPRTVTNALAPPSPTRSIPQNQSSAAEPHATDGKRVLRSKDGLTRSRSDLALFFPNYDDFVFGEQRLPKETIGLDATFFIADQPKASRSTTTSPQKADPNSGRARIPHPSFSISASVVHGPDASFNRLDFSEHLKDTRKFQEDPLGDDIYLKAHKRGERREKQLRNIEKERAMHEKGELERLLEELKGPDWLKAMGISGITETEKKHFEPKRAHYVRKVQELLDKFTSWREQEKELKHKIEHVAAVGHRNRHQVSERPKQVLMRSPEESHEVHSAHADTTPRKQKPSTAKETPAADVTPKKQITKTPLKSPSLVALTYAEPEPTGPFTSFFSKPYERAAAVGKHRRGRTVTAFGHPIPEAPEHEFALPQSLMDDEALMTQNARKRRRIKRDSVAQQAS